MKKKFDDSGDFQAFYAATKWLDMNGFSYGSMQGPEPIGVIKGDCAISKWRNLSALDKKHLDGVITGDKRNGPVFVEIYNP